MPRKAGVKTIKKKLDKEWGRLVRSKGECEVCGKTGYLNAHHIVGRRTLGLRWNVANGCCLCSGCHTLKRMSAHQDPVWFIDWLEKNRPDDLKLVREWRHKTVKWTKEELKELLEKMRETKV